MIKPEDIPPEVVEAALEAFAFASGLGIMPDDENDEDWREDLVNGMTTAIAAAINAWPMMHVHEWQRPWLGGMSGTDVILPMKENTSD